VFDLRCHGNRVHNSPQTQPRQKVKRVGHFSRTKPLSVTNCRREGLPSFEHMLLQPRSAPERAQRHSAAQLARLLFCAPLHVGNHLQMEFQRRTISERALAPSIFGADRFDRGVVTHSTAGSDLHGHRPILQSKRLPSEVLWMSQKLLGLLTYVYGFLRIASTAYQ